VAVIFTVPGLMPTTIVDGPMVGTMEAMLGSLLDHMTVLRSTSAPLPNESTALTETGKKASILTIASEGVISRSKQPTVTGTVASISWQSSS